MAQEQNSFGSALTRLSMRQPISVLVLALGVVLAAVFCIRQTRRNVLPDIDIPTIYVATDYGGMEPAQMEAYITSLYEALFLFVSGVEHVESKSVQSISVIEIEFYPGTDMGQALSEVTTYANRAKASMPAGAVPPFVMRYGVANQPVGDLVFSSEHRSLAEVSNFALNQVRPLFASLPGVSAAAPFGANSKAVVISVDPAKLRRYNLSSDDVVRALGQSDLVSPAGNIPMGGMYPLVDLNSVVANVQDLRGVPLRLGTSPSVFLGDVAKIAIGGDTQTGYALVNGHRTIYIPVTKQDQASTLTVVDEVKAAIPLFQSVLPPDIKVSFEFDQSGYVREAIGSLVFEGVIGALLTGLMVLLFLRDWRSSLIVVLNIPLAVLAAVIALDAAGQTINIMTLGGLALAIGVLVDETTVTIENIHTHMEGKSSVPRAALEATAELFIPKLFTLLAFLAVFTPAFFMTGIPRNLFIPLALAVGFTLIASFLLSTTFVPVLSSYLLKASPEREKEDPAKDAKPHGFDAFRRRYGKVVAAILPWRKTLVAVYFSIAILVTLGLFGFVIGREIFPQVDEGQFQIRFRAPTGTYMDRTEAIVLKALGIIQKDAGGEGQVATTVAYVGAQSYNLPVNAVYLWTSGPQEAVLDVALKPGSKVKLVNLRETLRRDFARELSGTAISFEPASLVERTMSTGSTTPIDVAVSGFDLGAVRKYGDKVMAAMGKIPQLRDLQYGQALEYPALNVDVDRRKAGIAGFTVQGLSQALVPATSSSRFDAPVFWADTKLGTSFIVQVQVPQGKVTSAADLRKLPISLNGATLKLGGVATVTTGTALGEIDRYNSQRTMNVTANMEGIDLGGATKLVERTLKSLAPQKPRGVTVTLRGQSAPLVSMFDELGLGLALAVVVVLLLLVVNFESVSLGLVIISTAPAVVTGVALMLLCTRTTLNIESYMGTIMAVGVALANSILLVTFAEKDRLLHGDAVKAALEGAQSRLRPILMTSLAMGAGMVPMALGWSEGGQQSAPLGRAVIGGLCAATLTTLFVVPLMFAIVQGGRDTKSPSLDPDDPGSPNYEKDRSGAGPGASGTAKAAAALLVLALLSAVPGRAAMVQDGAPPSGGPLGLGAVLRMAEEASPALQAGRERETQAQASAWGAAAFYYPHVVAAAATGKGLAGSPGQAPLGVGGVMGSPYAAGPKIGADVSAYWNVLNVSQMLNQSAVEEEAVSAQDQVRIERIQVDQAALIQYYDAVRAQGQAGVWHAETVRVAHMYKEVSYFESVGRYSEVELLLLKEMMEQASLAAAVSDEQTRFALQDLAVTLGRQGVDFSVPSTDEVSESDLDAITEGGLNPLLVYARSQVEAGRKLERASAAQSLPQLFANASIGNVDKTLVVPESDYSVSVGVALPVFEGFQNASDFKRARAVSKEREALLEDTQRQVTYANDRYDDAVSMASLSLQSLRGRNRDARRNLELSRYRYLHLVSPLADLQQALVNLTEIELELSGSRADILSALGAQKLFNGGSP
jgi:multidrug efflux pump subunit AcrB/outer membrane protein TolC